MLSEHTNILQTKLEDQYRINKMNEINAREAVSKVLDTLNELTEERNYLTTMDYNICKSCQEDIAEFRDALQNPLVTLKAIFDNFDRNSFQNLPIKENILSILKNFVFIIEKRISEIKLKFSDLSVGHRQFAHDYMLVFPKNVNEVMERVSFVIDLIYYIYFEVLFYYTALKKHQILHQLKQFFAYMYM